MTHDDPLQPHSHEPNPSPPSADPTFTIHLPHGSVRVTVADLRRLPLTTVPDCLIVSTGHGTSGPFDFGGVTLLELIEQHAAVPWTAAAVISADGFGTRLTAAELRQERARPVLLAYEIDGRVMTREEGLVRLIVPSEHDDALRQVKWVGEIRLLA